MRRARPQCGPAQRCTCSPATASAWALRSRWSFPSCRLMPSQLVREQRRALAIVRDALDGLVPQTLLPASRRVASLQASSTGDPALWMAAASPPRSKAFAARSWAKPSEQRTRCEICISHFRMRTRERLASTFGEECHVSVLFFMTKWGTEPFLTPVARHSDSPPRWAYRTEVHRSRVPLASGTTHSQSKQCCCALPSPPRQSPCLDGSCRLCGTAGRGTCWRKSHFRPRPPLLDVRRYFVPKSRHLAEFAFKKNCALPADVTFVTASATRQSTMNEANACLWQLLWCLLVGVDWTGSGCYQLN